jgi:hypothetical protein
MKRHNNILALFAFFVFLISALISCGGGSGAVEADFVSITVDGAGTVLYTETTNTSAETGYSPYLWSSATTSIGTYLYSADWDPAVSDYAFRFEIHVWGVEPGTYKISDNIIVYFTPAGGPAYSCVTGAANTGGSVTFTEVGPTGGKVKGYFDVTSVLVSSPTQTAHVSGSFSVTRY